MMTRAFWGAAVMAGVLVWASKQPGGIPGTWMRLKRAANDIRHGADPVEAGRRFVRGEAATQRFNDPALRPGL
jgi:hypothetical protein